MVNKFPQRIKHHPDIHDKSHDNYDTKNGSSHDNVSSYNSKGVRTNTAKNSDNECVYRNNNGSDDCDVVVLHDGFYPHNDYNALDVDDKKNPHNDYDALDVDDEKNCSRMNTIIRSVMTDFSHAMIWCTTIDWTPMIILAPMYMSITRKHTLLQLN